MPLSFGDKLGPYEILAKIGAGGMGEVYRAHDPRLRRDVAIKVSAERFSERFEREAHAVAALNHPNICSIYDVGPNYLVMEFVEGTAPEGPLPLEEVLHIARQIGDALEEAHGKGVVHRDLKPGNIMIKPDGTVKVLDFGLAKRTPEQNRDDSKGEDSPTLSMAATQAGMILGTAAYMPPEQAKGKSVDKRADIWAFGVVLYEMITGRRLFRGETATDILAAVLKNEPDLEQVPANVRRLLRNCLEKDPRKRLRDIGDAWKLVDEEPVQTRAPRLSKLLVGAVAALTVALAVVWWNGSRTPPETQWSAEFLGGSNIAFQPSISPDGQTLAFLAMVDSLAQVAVMKPGSGSWQTLTHDRTHGYAAEISWSLDGTKLYFTRFQGGPRGIYTVPVIGGGEERLVLEDAAIADVVPDGSFLIARLNSGRRKQLHQYWPETGRLQTLNVLLGSIDTAPARITPAGDRVAFFGTPLDRPDAPNQFYAMDLRSGAAVRLGPDVAAPDASINTDVAIGPDGASVVFNGMAGDALCIFSAPIGGSGEVRRLLTLTERISGLDVAPDGSLYIGQGDRNGEVVRLSPSGGTPERIGTALSNTAVGGVTLPLPDGRVVFSSQTANQRRLLVARPGKESEPFVQTQDVTAAPAALISRTEAAFTIGEAADRTIGLVSIADGRLAKRLNGPKGADIRSMAASPDGRTIYYTASGSVWSVPVSDGTPQKLRPGDSVTVDPYKNELIVQLIEKEAVRLVRTPLKGGPERTIPVQAGIRIAPVEDALHPNGVSKDGLILVRVAPSSSWFWPTGVLDPQTGRVRIPSIGYDADMSSAGWADDGKIVVLAYPFRSSLWHFRTEESKR